MRTLTREIENLLEEMGHNVISAKVFGGTCHIITDGFGLKVIKTDSGYDVEVHIKDGWTFMFGFKDAEAVIRYIIKAF